MKRGSLKIITIIILTSTGGFGVALLQSGITLFRWNVLLSADSRKVNHVLENRWYAGALFWVPVHWSQRVNTKSMFTFLHLPFSGFSFICRRWKNFFVQLLHKAHCLGLTAGNPSCHRPPRLSGRTWDRLKTSLAASRAPCHTSDVEMRKNWLRSRLQRPLSVQGHEGNRKHRI